MRASVTGILSGPPNVFVNDRFSSATGAALGSLPFAVTNDQKLRDS
jgi:hypothetical protein